LNFFKEYYLRFIHLIRFYSCGILISLIVWTILFALRFLNIEYLICVNIATVIGIICGFSLHKYYVFESSGKFVHQFIKYILLQIPLIITTNILFYWLVSVLKIEFVYSAILIIPLISLTNYIFSKRIFYTNACQ
jgi:putative flippase GtrA